MKKLVILFISGLLAANAFSNGCDSIVYVQGESKNDDGSWSPYSNETRTYNDGRIVSINSGQVFSNYTYDNQNRLILINNSNQNLDSFAYDSFSNLTFHYNFIWNNGWTPFYEFSFLKNISGKDSVLTRGEWDGTNVSPQYRILTFYNSFDSISRTTTQNYDTVQHAFVDESISIYSWAADNLSYADSTYSLLTGTPELQLIDNIIYDSLRNIISDCSYGSFTNPYPGSCQNFHYCNGVQLPSSSYSTTGSGQDYFSTSYLVESDSLCRPMIIYSTTQFQGTQPFSRRTLYYYADCNHITVIGATDIFTCSGSPSNVPLQIIGGSGIQNFHWLPGDSVSDPNTLYPTFNISVSQNFQLQISDTTGDTTYQTFHVQVIDTLIYLTSNASCSTCHDGAVYFPYEPDFIPSISPQHFYNSTMEGYFGLTPGSYQLCRQNNSCLFCDSVFIGFTTGIFSQVDSHINISPNPFNNLTNVNLSAEFFKEKARWEIIDINSNSIMSGESDSPEIIIERKTLLPGIYFLKINSAGTIIRKLVIIDK